MAVYRIAIGSPREASHPAAIRAAFAEFFSMLIFVFAGQGSGMAYSKLTNNGPATPEGLIVASLSHAFGLFVAVSVGANISGGHVNPAVTFGAFVGGNITLLRSILYWIAQLFGSVVACILLNFATGGMSQNPTSFSYGSKVIIRLVRQTYVDGACWEETSAFSLSSGVSVWNALVFEIVMTFGLVYTVYATAVDPKKGNVGVVAPIAIGFIVGANILVGGAFDGASMNPAVSFGPALVSWSWTHHWVYWLGPFIGSAAAAIIYDNIFIGDDSHQPLSNTDF
ncbi:hypothetical protein Lal_00000140 [Lupinus albus]|nr:hypothetical protein Lal_00000140 [Lupinus albus]